MLNRLKALVTGGRFKDTIAFMRYVFLVLLAILLIFTDWKGWFLLLSSFAI